MIRFYRGATVLFGLVFIGLGVSLLVVTVVRGGGATGYLIGVLFVALGLGRLYLLRSK